MRDAQILPQRAWLLCQALIGDPVMSTGIAAAVGCAV